MNPHALDTSVVLEHCAEWRKLLDAAVYELPPSLYELKHLSVIRKKKYPEYSCKAKLCVKG